MATYRPRPDGLVDVQLDSGQTLPMSEVQAQMGGATPEAAPALPGGLPAPPGPGPTAGATPPPGAPPGPMPSPQLGPNPYSMIASGEATAQGVPPDQVENARRASDAIVGGVKKFGNWLTKPMESDIFGNPIGTPSPAAPPAAPPPAASGAPAAAAPAPAPGAGGGGPAVRDGGYQLDQPLTLTGGGLPLETRTVHPGVSADPSFKRTMQAIDPEEVRDEHFRGAQDVMLARDEAIEAERLANEKQSLDNEDRKNDLAQKRARLQEKQDAIEQREREASQATPQGRSEIMASRGTLSKMMGALSIMMGARYQGMTGRNNPGLDLINQTIAQDIADQRAKYEAAKDRVGMANNDYAKAMQLYGDPNVAEADLYNRQLTLAANIAKNHWKQAENTEEYQKQKEVGVILGEQAAQKKQDAHTLLKGQILQDTYRREPVTVQGDISDSDRERMVIIPGYGNGFVANRGQQPEVQKRATAGGTALNLVAQLKQLMPESGPVNDLTARKQLDPYRLAALAAISEAQGQGVVTKADGERAKDILGDENAFFTRGAASLDATERTLRIALDGLAGTLFGDPRSRTRMPKKRADSFKPGLDQ